MKYNVKASSDATMVKICSLCVVVYLLTLLKATDAFASNAFSPTAAKNQIGVTFSPPAAADDEWDPFLDETCAVDPPEEATVEHLLNEPALARAFEIAGICFSKIVIPFGSSVLTRGFSGDWNEFWAQRHHDGKTNAQHLTEALEELGPVYVKLGQALGSRPDAIPLSLANSLLKLQDCMQPFDAESAKRIATQELLETKKLTGKDMDDLLECLSQPPESAASVGQVYKAQIGSKTVAVKIQRPGIRAVMERDAALLRTLANWVESIPAPAALRQENGTDRLIASELESAVEGFFQRIVEELDYRNEMENAAKFASLYSHRGGTSEKAHVVVPEFYPELCTENILVMEWLEGDKLTDFDEDDELTIQENLDVIKQAIDCTLSQLLDTGVLHADPHGYVTLTVAKFDSYNCFNLTIIPESGNLLKIHTANGPQLGYLDFGLLSSVPQQVRDALVCAIAHLVFDHDSEAVAMLFGELELVPNEVIEDPEELQALTNALNQTMHAVLVYPEHVPGEIQFPELQFDILVQELTKLVPRFKFRLPPYFMQKARAISYLEGMARGLDSDFNVLQMLYPYALNRLLVNPTNSPILQDTLQNLLRSPETGRVEINKISRLLEDSAHLTGYKRRRVVRDVLKTTGGRRLARTILREQIGNAPSQLRSRFRRHKVEST